jgi:hypothetical protein
MKKILDWFSRLFKWEILNQTKKTKEELNNLSTGLIDEQLNLADKEISDKEKEIIKKITDLDNADKNIEGWFTWLEDINDEDFVSQEKEYILSKLKIVADNEGNTWEWDLNEEEFKNISKFAKTKKELCDTVLKCDEIKALPEDKKTKKAIIDACNSVLSDPDINWDISKVTKDKIIEKLNNPVEQEPQN